MRLKSPWTARLAEAEGTPSNRLLEALSQDIVSGQLQGGDRLPPHRELAWTLGLGVGTVTKAYAMLERRGLARSIKGRGTFVAALQPDKRAAINLSVNSIPVMLSDRLLARTLSTISRKIDSNHVNLRPPLAGHDEHRRLLGRWLESLHLHAEADRIILTGSGQQALWLAFDILCGGRGLIITERLSYSGAIALARYRGHPVRGVETDAEGMLPEDLARVLDADDQKARRRLVYVTPTLHNPTTVTMSRGRRQEIVDICRRRAVPIVEDGVYTLGADAQLPPLAELAADSVFHVTSLSKTLTDGLRLGVLVVPSGWESRAQEALQILPLAASPVDYALLEEWFTNGVVDTVRTSLRAEARRRVTLATSLLAGRAIQMNPTAFHVWLPMQHAEAEAFSLAAQRLGVIVTPPDAVRADVNDQATGIRLCLGGPSIDELTRGLSLLAQLPAENADL
jgi:DNA-binding transcriptional MocR family regulator